MHADSCWALSRFMPEIDASVLSTNEPSFDVQPNQITLFQKNQHIPRPQQVDIYQGDRRWFPAQAQLDLPRTYSFQESTFGRRIARATFESAYRLLLDPRRRPADYERIFRLSLIGRDRAAHIASLKTQLDKGPHEDLVSIKKHTSHLSV